MKDNAMLLKQLEQQIEGHFDELVKENEKLQEENYRLVKTNMAQDAALKAAIEELSQYRDQLAIINMH